MTRALAPVDAVVVGPGLAAAAVALELARRDLTVELLCPGRPGAPSGPGGPVAAQATAATLADAGLDLALLSRHLFGDWISGLEEETGIPCEYDERGALALALDEAEEVVLDRALDRQRAAGLPFEVLDAEEARGREPSLTPELHAAFSFPRDGAVRAGRVGRALALAARTAGVRVREGLPAPALSLSAGRVAGLETLDGLLPAETVVLADTRGAGLLAGPPGLRLSSWSRPWLRLDASADPDRPGRLLVSRGLSLVPRRDGAVLVLGRPGPDPSGGHPTAGAVARLLAEAARLVPALEGWPLVAAGVDGGARAADGLPVLGESGVPGLLLVAGLGPEELLLAPGVAAIAADLVLGRAPGIGIAPFAPGRLAGRAGRSDILPG